MEIKTMKHMSSLTTDSKSPPRSRVYVALTNSELGTRNSELGIQSQPPHVGCHFWKGLLAVGLLASIGSALGAGPGPSVAVSDWNIVGNIPLERVVIQSHRGAGVLAEENTLAAFELGWK